MNGLAEQSQPSSGTPISYPFSSYDGKVSFARETWGKRVFDINKDGVANYGMYPDWLQELRVLAGKPILTDMFHGAEAYLEMWERAYGVPSEHCLSTAQVRRLRRGESFASVLYAVGQPLARGASSYAYCGAKNRRFFVGFDRRGRVRQVWWTHP
jgi:hypothetical protein